jgi:hypothetical protein
MQRGPSLVLCRRSPAFPVCITEAVRCIVPRARSSTRIPPMEIIVANTINCQNVCHALFGRVRAERVRAVLRRAARCSGGILPKALAVGTKYKYLKLGSIQTYVQLHLRLHRQDDRRCSPAQKMFLPRPHLHRTDPARPMAGTGSMLAHPPSASAAPR